jgi:hypothetical protein
MLARMGRRSLPVRSPLLAFLFVATFAAGALSQRLLLREAHADPTASTATLYVPPDGLVFRTLDGTPVARISRDAHGGVFELYDDQQRPVRRVPAGAPAMTATTAIASGTGATLARDPGF